MAVYTDKSIFLHTPKTGGAWVTYNLKNLGILKMRDKGSSIYFGGLSIHNIPDAGTPKWCFVRNPLEWYKSIYSYAKKRHGLDRMSLLVNCKSGSFEGFIDNILSFYPNGFCSDFFNTYIKSCNFVGKQETLEEDFIKVLNSLEINFDKNLIFKRKVNVSEYLHLKYTNYQKDSILSAEKDIIEKYYT